MTCMRCGTRSAAAVGFSLYEDGLGIRSVATAERCVACGKISSFRQWMERSGDMSLLDLV